MKARKSNAMWGVTLFLILGFAYFLNATDFLSKPLFPEAPKKETNAAGPSAAETKNMMATKLRENRQPKEEGEAPVDPAGATIPSEPAIFKPKQERYEPTVNETSTSAQWWNKNNAVEVKGEKVKKDRGY
ncbi:MAG: hypothetical protein ACKVQS_01425 [Fimbriimonadaceae bacterium]